MLAEREGKRHSEEAKLASSKLMCLTGIYRLIGLITLLLAGSCFLFKPRWVGLVALPIGIYAANLSMIIM
jgi:hypothetical protein